MPEVLDPIRDWLKAEGFELGCYGTCGHTCGLPPGVLVKPGYTPVDGAHALLVTTTEIIPATCMYPSNYNDWRIRRRVPYGSREELKKVLGEMLIQPRGCW